MGGWHFDFESFDDGTVAFEAFTGFVEDDGRVAAVLDGGGDQGDADFDVVREGRGGFGKFVFEGVEVVDSDDKPVDEPRFGSADVAKVFTDGRFDGQLCRGVEPRIVDRFGQQDAQRVSHGSSLSGTGRRILVKSAFFLGNYPFFTESCGVLTEVNT